MIKFYKRTVQDKAVREISNFEIGCWVNVTNPTEKELKQIVKKFKLDERNIESGIDENEIPRFDVVKGDSYILTKVISNTKEQTVDTYLIVVGKSYILTLSKNSPGFAKRILDGEVDFVTTQKLKCVINLLSLINEEFEKATINIIKTVQGRKRLSSDLKESELSDLLEKEDVLNNFVSSYYYMNLLYERLIRKIDFFEQDKEIIEDLIVESNQGFNLCKSSLRTISNIRNYYVILLSNKLNKVINILTVFTILISFPAAVSGIYGMNIILPFQNDPLAFYYILGFLMIIWVTFILYLKKRRII